MTNDIDVTRGGASTSASDDATSVHAGERFLRIDEVARRTGLTKRTLRYYEELGLLAPAQRSEGNYRLYSEADIHMLEQIIAMRDLLGLELKEIREMVTAEMERERIKAQWLQDADPARRLRALDTAEQVTHRQLALLEEKLAGMERMRQTLEERLTKYSAVRAEIQAQARKAPASPAAPQPSADSPTR